ncbi:GNAT family N-acetyltransferase [Streptomyces salinarius]|uniref:GNAT family N-acetyltransferase n=1 Tax=Streptomyces salinarius TaxID=2762598 RepID=UPI0013DC103D|nr:GNAT family protein [Streptomyces salinarius]
MLFPHTWSRRLELRPASAADQTAFTRTILRTGIESISPSSRNSAPSSRRSSAAFLIAHRKSGNVIGFSTLYGMDPAGHLRSGIYLDPARSKLGVGSEGIYLTINYAFAMFNIEKVITQTTEATFASLGLASRNSEAKGLLDEYLYFRGRHWDLHSFQIERAEWERHVAADLDHVLDRGLSWREAPGRTSTAR